MNKVEQVASVQSLSTITGIENQYPLVNPAKVSPTRPRTGGQKYRSDASGKASCDGQCVQGLALRPN